MSLQSNPWIPTKKKAQLLCRLYNQALTNNHLLLEYKEYQRARCELNSLLALTESRNRKFLKVKNSNTKLYQEI